MSLIYLGPAKTLDLGDGQVVARRGEITTLHPAIQRALEKAGHRFLDQASGSASPPRKPPPDPDDVAVKS